jgi:hypothetical protein
VNVVQGYLSRERNSRKRERGSQGSERERLENGTGNEVIEQALG